MYYNARWYDPILGRFTQADTIIPSPGNSKAWDRYAYTYNNPINYSDPGGHDPWWLGNDPIKVSNYYSNGGGAIGAKKAAWLFLEPKRLGLAPGFSESGNKNDPGPTWNFQMDGWQTDKNNKLFGLPTYSSTYPGTADANNYGKTGQSASLLAENDHPSLPTALFGMSGGSESSMLALKTRLEQGYKTTHVVLFGPTWTGTGRDGFQAWTDIIDAALKDGTHILVINDASLAPYEGTIYETPSTYETLGSHGTFTRGDVPYGGYTLCHHSSNCWTSIGVNNSTDLINSVTNWMNGGQWSWPH